MALAETYPRPQIHLFSPLLRRVWQPRTEGGQNRKAFEACSSIPYQEGFIQPIINSLRALGATGVERWLSWRDPNAQHSLGWSSLKIKRGLLGERHLAKFISCQIHEMASRFRLVHPFLKKRDEESAAKKPVRLEDLTLFEKRERDILHRARAKALEAKDAHTLAKITERWETILETVQKRLSKQTQSHEIDEKLKEIGLRIPREMAFSQNPYFLVIDNIRGEAQSQKGPCPRVVYLAHFEKRDCARQKIKIKICRLGEIDSQTGEISFSSSHPQLNGVYIRPPETRVIETTIDFESRMILPLQVRV